MTRVPQEVTGFFKTVWEGYQEEIGKAWKSFFDSLSDAWSNLFRGGWWSLILGGFVRNIVVAVVDSVDAVQELGEDLALAPYRVINDVAAASLPLPKGLNSKVMTAEAAFRSAIHAIATAGINIIDGDLPVLFDWITQAKKAGEVAEASDNWSKVPNLGAIRGIIVSTVVLAAVRLASVVIGLFVILSAVVLYFGVWSNSGPIYEAFTRGTLAQDSERVRVEKRSRVRRNARPGKDKR